MKDEIGIKVDSLISAARGARVSPGVTGTRDCVGRGPVGHGADHSVFDSAMLDFEEYLAAVEKEYGPSSEEADFVRGRMNHARYVK